MDLKTNLFFLVILFSSIGLKAPKGSGHAHPRVAGAPSATLPSAGGVYWEGTLRGPVETDAQRYVRIQMENKKAKVRRELVSPRKLFDASPKGARKRAAEHRARAAGKPMPKTERPSRAKKPSGQKGSRSGIATIPKLDLQKLHSTPASSPAPTIAQAATDEDRYSDDGFEPEDPARQMQKSPGRSPSRSPSRPRTASSRRSSQASSRPTHSSRSSRSGSSSSSSRSSASRVSSLPEVGPDQEAEALKVRIAANLAAAKARQRVPGNARR